MGKHKTKVAKKAPPKPGHGPGYFLHAANERSLEYANEALEMARADVLELQQKTLNSFNLLVAGRGDFGTDMLRTVDAHARTREFGALLWNDALIGRAVLELIFRERTIHNRVIAKMIEQAIEHRESQRPHRRLSAWFRRLVGRPGPEVSRALTPGEESLIDTLARYELSEGLARRAHDEARTAILAHVAEAATPGERVTVFPRSAMPLVAAIERPLQPGELGEGTDEELAAIREAIGDDTPEGEEPSEPETPEPETVTYPEPGEHLGNDVPGAMDDGIDGADEYRDNAKQDGEEKAQP